MKRVFCHQLLLLCTCSMIPSSRPPLHSKLDHKGPEGVQLTTDITDTTHRHQINRIVNEQAMALISHNLLDTLGVFWTFHWTHVRQFTVVQNHNKSKNVPEATQSTRRIQMLRKPGVLLDTCPIRDIPHFTKREF